MLPQNPTELEREPEWWCNAKKPLTEIVTNGYLVTMSEHPFAMKLTVQRNSRLTHRSADDSLQHFLTNSVWNQPFMLSLFSVLTLCHTVSCGQYKGLEQSTCLSLHVPNILNSAVLGKHPCKQKTGYIF